MALLQGFRNLPGHSNKSILAITPASANRHGVLARSGTPGQVLFSGAFHLIGNQNFFSPLSHFPRLVLEPTMPP
jgi:hypothetical protein